MNCRKVILSYCHCILFLLIVFSWIFTTGCGGNKLAARYGMLFSPGEGLSYRSFVFEVPDRTYDPFPEKRIDLYAYYVMWAGTHIKQVTEAVFEDAKLFTEDLGAVKFDGKWGYIQFLSTSSFSFEYAIEPQFEGAEPFSEGLAAVKQDGKYGYIDKTGTIIIQPSFTQAHYFNGGLAAVSDDRGWYFIDEYGQVIISGPFEEAESFTGDLAPVKINGKWGYINRSGTLVIEAIYDDAWSFEYSGKAAVKKDGRWMMINSSGKKA